MDQSFDVSSRDEDQFLSQRLTYAFSRRGLIKGMSCISSCVTLTAVWCESALCTGAIRLQVGFALCRIEYTLLLCVVVTQCHKDLINCPLCTVMIMFVHV